MPTWIQGPDGSPVYVDEFGQPASPLALGGGTDLDPQALAALASYTGAPGVAPQAPVVQAAQVPAPAAPPVVAEGLSASRAGFSPEQFQRVQRTQGGLEGDIAQERQRADQRAGEVAGAVVGAGQQSTQAVQATTQAEVDRIAARGAQDLVLKSLQESFQREEASAAAEEGARSKAAMARYEAALLDSRGRVDPAAIFKGEGGTGFSIASAAAMFAHGFLGARGIGTPAKDMLMSAIDRSIDAQVDALNRKGKVAEGFRALWDMQRAESATDQEARARVRGFVLEAAKNGVAAELSKYDSQLAGAKGQEAVAALNEELVKNLTEVYRAADQNAAVATGQRIDIWKAKVQASLQREGFQVDRERIGAQARTGDDKTAELVVRDEKGNVVGVADTKDQKLDMQEKIVGADGVQRRLLEAQEMMRAEGRVYSGPAAAAFVSRNEAKLRSLYNDLVSNYNRAVNGARASDKDAERIEKILPFNGFALGLVSGETPAEAVLARFGVRSVDDLRTASLAQLRPPTPEIAQAYRGGAGGELFAAPRTAQDIVAEGRDKPAADTAVDRATKTVLSPTAGTLADDSIGRALKEGRRVPQKEWESGMRELAQIATSPVETPEVRQSAVRQLGQFVALPDPEKSAMAAQLLLDLSNTDDPTTTLDDAASDWARSVLPHLTEGAGPTTSASKEPPRAR